MASDITWTNEKRKLAQLIPWEHNPRLTRTDQAERMVDSLDIFGQVQTIAIGPDSEIYDGHQRKFVWSAAEQFGPDYEVDVRVSSRELTERERQQLVVYLHRGATGEWDFDTLANGFDVGDLLEWGFEEVELGLAGFDLGNGPEDPGPQIDKAAELQEKWQVQRGQVWQCGEHFIICDDCREAETWERLLSVAKVDKVNGVFTSPPYAEQRKEQYGGVPIGEYVDWWEAVQANVRANLANDGSFFINIKPHCENGQRVLYVFDLVLAMARRWGWRFVDELCWYAEGLPGAFPNRFRNSFEPVFHFCREMGIRFRPKSVGHFSSAVRNGTGGLDKTAGGNWTINVPIKSGIAQPGNVLKIGASAISQHAAAFPVALSDFFIRAYSDPGDIWLDPFLGSGTTIAAAHQNERRGLGIELLEKYCAVTLERLAGMGLEPELAGAK